MFLLLPFLILSSFIFYTLMIESNSNSDLQISQEEARKYDLLRMARKSRHQWIVDGAGSDYKSTATTDEILKKIPAAETLQEVLNLLSDITDSETIGISALQFYDADDDDESDEYIAPITNDANPYFTFIEKLKSRRAIEIVKSMEKFVASIEVESRDLSTFTQEKIEARIETIWQFFKSVESIMKTNTLWSTETTSEWEQSKESCAKFMFTKLYPVLFATDIDDSVKDRKLSERIASLSFLSAEHLDLNKNIKGEILLNNIDFKLQPASQILRGINAHKSPDDKLQVIRQTSHSIIQILSAARKSKTPPGADEFLPALILVVKEANPEQLSSTVTYLQRYTHPSKFVSEAGYLLTHFLSAVHFLETVDANALTISPLEFEMSISRSRALGMKQSEMARVTAFQMSRDYTEGDSRGGESGGGVAKDKGRGDGAAPLKNAEESMDRDGDRGGKRVSLPALSAREIYLRRCRCAGEAEAVSAVGLKESATDRTPLSRPLDMPSRGRDGPASRGGGGGLRGGGGGLEVQGRMVESILRTAGTGGSTGHGDLNGFVDEISRTSLVTFYDKDLESIPLSDLPRLLAEYKMLVRACAGLLHQNKSY